MTCRLGNLGGILKFSDYFHLVWCDAGILLAKRGKNMNKNDWNAPFYKSAINFGFNFQSTFAKSSSDFNFDFSKSDLSFLMAALINDQLSLIQSLNLKDSWNFQIDKLKYHGSGIYC